MHTKIFVNKKFNETIKLINDSKPIYFIINHIKKYTNLNDFIILIKNNELNFKQFLLLCDIEYELFILLINSIKITSKGNYRQIYCNEYKLLLIFELRNNIVKWKDLSKSIYYEPINCPKYHYKSIHSQYCRWCHNNIFKNAFLTITPYDNDDNIDINIDGDDDDDDYYIIDSNNDLFIDASNINNKLGSEEIMINPELHKKNITKLTSISNIDGFIYSIVPISVNKKTILFNKKKRIIKTAPNDSVTIQFTVNNINDKINIKSNNINLIGDKSYKTNTNNIIKTPTNKIVTMITPNKINQKNNLIKKSTHKKLGYRNIIENTICSFKKNERINLRKDRKIKTFMGWVYISCLNHNLRVNKRLKKINII